MNNLQPDENGEITVKIETEKYSVVHALVLDSKSVYEENLYLDFNNTIKRDLSMSNPLNPSKCFSELRKTETILKGNKFNMKDLTSTSFKIIDSIDKYISFFNLCNTNQTLKNNWNNLNFLLKFEELPHEIKLKKLSENFSHEVNLYLYFKHHEFFTKNIKPILKFKSEKTFVDFFLLNDIQRIKEFTSSAMLNGLNAFEKCLLIYVIRKDNPELAQTIAKNMRASANQIKLNEKEIKRLFNIIMNMKIDDVNIPSNDSYSGDFNSDSNLLKNQAVFMSTRPSATVFNEKCEVDFQSNPKPMLQKKKMKCKKEAAFDCAFDEDTIQKVNIKNNLYRDTGKGKEYKETHYYNCISGEVNFFPNPFFADLAEYWANNINSNLATDFVSINIIHPIYNLPQLVATLAVLDLPINSVSQTFNRSEGLGLEIIANSNFIIFTKEISETTINKDVKSNLMIAQVTNKKNVQTENLLVNEDNENETGIDSKYIINEIYRHETIVTNISNKTISFELLVQVPEGSIPVDGSDYTKTINLTLDKFKTTKIEMFFYFPKVGNFIQFPPNASIDGIVVSKAKELNYEVVENIIKTTHSTLDDVLESGTKQEILSFLTKKEYFGVSENSKVYWLLKDKEFYSELIKIFKSRGFFDYVVWGFGFYHHDQPIIREFLEKNQGVKQIIGPYANFSLLQIDKTNNFDIMRHYDFHPILNSRVHRVGQQKDNSILNREFKETYEEFINHLITLKEIDSKNYIRLTYYLILQDRIEDALKVYERIDTNSFNNSNSLSLQYDYISAYLDFSTGYPGFKTARSICEKYKNFPLNHWKDLFEEIEDQLLEYDGKVSMDDIESIMDEQKKKKQTNKIAIQTESKLSFTIENKQLQILYTNINSVTIKFYLIDLEILFSRTPFIKQNSDDFSFVQPNFVQNTILESSSKENILNFPIPNEFISTNLFIEVSTRSKKCFDTYFSTSLTVSISEAMGELKVVDPNLKALTKVYVKCFAKFNDESVKFYKDGYTDLRGKFNYVSLNTDQLNSIKKFALFIYHDEFGSIIKEANPPSNIEGSVKDDNVNSYSQYDQFQNYKQEIKNIWKSQNKKSK